MLPIRRGWPHAVQGCPCTVRMRSGDVRGLPACCQGCPGTVRMLSGNVRVLSACCPGMSGITVRMLSGDGRFASMPSMFDDDDDDDRDTKRDNNFFTCGPVGTLFMKIYPKPAMHKTLCCWLHLATAKIAGQCPYRSLLCGQSPELLTGQISHLRERLIVDSNLKHDCQLPLR